MQDRNVDRAIIRKREDNSEIVKYDSDTFPCFAFDGYITGNEPWLFKSHWHEDIEILSVYKGKMAYNINGRIVEISKGQTLFLNPKCVHYSLDVDKTFCEYYIIVAHPSVLFSSIEIQTDYILPVITDLQLDYIILEEKAVISHCKNIWENHDNALEVTRELFNIWHYVYSAYKGKNSLSGSSNAFMAQTLKKMVFYIIDNYQGKVTLDEIAEAGNVSKSTCNNMFKRYTGFSPTSYLIHYRIQMASSLLTSTPDSIASISSACGFNSPSYMTEQFVKCLGKTPSQIREKS